MVGQDGGTLGCEPRPRLNSRSKCVQFKRSCSLPPPLVLLIQWVREEWQPLIFRDRSTSRSVPESGVRLGRFYICARLPCVWTKGRIRTKSCLSGGLERAIGPGVLLRSGTGVCGGPREGFVDTFGRYHRRPEGVLPIPVEKTFDLWQRKQGVPN